MNDALLFLLTLLASSIRLATPILFASLGGLIGERAGVVNLALEGMLLAGAFAGAVAAHLTGSCWIGLLAGVAAGALCGFLLALVTVPGRADQIVAGTAVNILVAGLCAVSARALFGVTGSTPALARSARFLEAPIPLLKKIPVVGPLLFEQIPLVYVALALGLFLAWFLPRSRVGLRLTAVGEAPDAAASAGVSVRATRIGAVVVGSAFAAAGGVFLSVGHASSFARNMSAGRGFIALAALILGQWRPLPVIAAAFLFGFADALGIALQGVPLPVVGQIPVQFVQMIPYVLTLLLLAGVTGRPRPPAGLGRPWPSDGA